jgi:hypothetical protein
MSDFEIPELAAAADGQLFEMYGLILAELKRRKLIRTANAPAGDYAEYLVARALGVELAPNAEKSFDVVAPAYGKVQVKARVVSEKITNSQRQTSPFRSDDYDYAVLVMLSSADYSVRHAVLVTQSMVEERATWKKHVNGNVLFMRPELMDHPNAIDITEDLRAAVSRG